ncbi:cell wall hydrolase [Sphingobium sp. H39-3-25]|uniref:cell wall hydrolase n=1 Tax=Sphingobium arseniciresistens TaxID=3030834 RepID=UPI0023B92A4C|nr:cell wall hydrolase [Sphingobium arseniciresistens]
MIVVHEAQPFAPPMPPPRRKRTGMLIAIILLFALAIGAAAAGVYFALREPERDTAPAAFRHKIVKINFDALPTRDDAEIVEETTVSDTAMLKHMSAEEATAFNARVPIVAGPNAPARPFTVPLGNGVNFLRSLDCMTAAIYYEAANEPVDGQRAVAQVILNRVRHVAYPHTVCGVVFQGWERRTGCQFSFTCDGSMARIPSRQGWLRARGIASAALSGLVYAPAGLSTHYHADYVVPYWASSLLKVQTIGRHIFYRWPGLWGKLAAFASPYAGNEMPIPVKSSIDPAEVASEGLIGEDGQPLLATGLSAERPVLRSGGVLPQGLPQGLPTPALAAGTQAMPERNYLSAKAPNIGATPPSAMPAPAPRSVTGGVIRAGAQSLPPGAPPAPAPASAPPAAAK